MKTQQIHRSFELEGEQMGLLDREAQHDGLAGQRRQPPALALTPLDLRPHRAVHNRLRRPQQQLPGLEHSAFVSETQFSEQQRLIAVVFTAEVTATVTAPPPEASTFSHSSSPRKMSGLVVSSAALP